MKGKIKQTHKHLVTIATMLAVVITTILSGFSLFSVRAAGDTSPIADSFDLTKKGSVTIHKYDMTAMAQDGLSTATNETGFVDQTAESSLSQYTIPGVVFHYLKVAEFSQETVDGSIDLLYAFYDEELIELLGLNKNMYSQQNEMGYSLKEEDVYFYNSTQLNKALSKKLSDDNTNTKNQLEEYLKTHDGIEMNETNQDGETSVSDLETGLYLFVETYVPEDVEQTTDPFLVSVPTSVINDKQEAVWNYDLHVYPKNQTDYPTIDKKVGDEDEYPNLQGNESKELHDYITASIGDTLDYRITSRLPKIHSKTTYFTKFGYVDELSKGLSYVKDSIQIAWYSSLSEAEKNDSSKAVALWKLNDASKKFEVSFEAEDQKMMIQMTDAGLNEMNPGFSEKYLVVSYQAIVNSKAVLGDDGNPNSATLLYSRTNTSYTDTLKDVANVFIYGVNLTKKFSDEKGDPTKVEFILQNIFDKQSDKVTSYFVTATGNNGIYEVTGEAANKEDATVFSPGADGVLKINGLEGDTYQLFEIKSDDGYTRLNGPITFEITSATALTKGQVKVTRSTDSKNSLNATSTDMNTPEEGAIYLLTDHASATVNDIKANMSTDGTSLNERVDVVVTNQKGFTFPKTGDSGTRMLVLLGVLIATGGCMLAMHGQKKGN